MEPRGVTVWFTGLSGAGKTTIARAVEAALRARGVPVERLDGDVVRQSLTRDLGFSREDREQNIDRVAFVAKLLTRHGVICLASFISPYRSMRARARQEIGDFLEVYVTAPLATLIETGCEGPLPEGPGREAAQLHRRQRPLRAAGAARPALGDGPGAGGGVRRPGDRALGSAGDLPPSGKGPVIAGAGPAPSEAGQGPVAPHGGQLVRRVLEGEAQEEALGRARELPVVELDERELADVEMIGCGALSPLVGFMGRLEYETVIGEMRLADGLLWPLPITLAVTREEAAAIREGQEVALVTPGEGGWWR